MTKRTNERTKNMDFFGSLTTKLTLILKRIALRFKEYSSMYAIDEFELEHLLLYHGLVGTSPENQRSFKHV